MRGKPTPTRATRTRLRTVLQAAACVSVVGLLAAVAASSATAQDVATVQDGPIIADAARGFTPATADTEWPPLPFPGLSPEEAEVARAELAARDRLAAAAAAAADRAYAALGDPTADPFPVELPPVEFVPYKPAPQPDWEVPRLAPPADAAADAASAGAQTTESACIGNCYQSDKLKLSDPPVGLYASEYWVWLTIPQSNEQNYCDGVPGSSGCFWFYAMEHHMDSGDHSNSAMHIGPQRGASLAGDSGNQWRMNIDGYIDGVHIGGQSPADLPTDKWIRVRIWRVSYGNDAAAPYKPWSKWGVWAMWDGNDRQLGSLEIDGHLLANSMLFSEVWEQDGQCSTDLDKGYFDNARYWNTSVSESEFSTATAKYEDNCDNTTWKPISGDHVMNQRETQRLIGKDGVVWPW